MRHAMQLAASHQRKTYPLASVAGQVMEGRTTNFNPGHTRTPRFCIDNEQMFPIANKLKLALTRSRGAGDWHAVHSSQFDGR